MAVGLQAGYATQSTCKILVVSNTLDDVIVSCNGQKYVAVMAVAGDAALDPEYDVLGDTSFRPPGSLLKEYGITEACFTGAVEVTGLSPFTRYSVSAKVGGDVASISFMSAPSEDDDFTLFIGTCISSNGHINNPTGSGQDGMFTYMQDYAANPGNLPIAGFFCIDDHLYIDRLREIIDDKADTGHFRCSRKYNGIGDPVTTGVEDHDYNYALAYLIPFDGFLSHNELSGNAKAAQTGARAWAYKNLNWMCQWGDHEFNNNIGLFNEAATYEPFYSKGKNAWDAFTGQLTPPRINTNNSAAWSATYGPVQLIAPDRVTNANDPTGSNGPLLGASQIADIKGAIGADPAPFKIMLMASSIRNMNVAGKGPQEPMWNMGSGSKAEYQNLFTDAGGMVDLSNANGFSFLTCHGDWHVGAAIKNENTDGVNPEDFYSLYAGTMNGSSNGTNWDDAFAVGDSYEGSIFVYFDDTTSDPVTNPPARKDYWVVQIEVFGSRSPKQMRVSLINKAKMSQAFTGWWEQGQAGNLPVVPHVPRSQI